MRDRDMDAMYQIAPHVIEIESSSPYLSPGRYNYWADLIFPCALACLNTVLRHSEAARADYGRIVKAWDLPEYEPLLDRLVGYLYRHTAPESATNDYVAQLPDLIRVGSVHTEDPSTERMRLMVFTFIERHFNPERRRPSITRERASYLSRVVVFRSMNDASEINPGLYEPWPTDELERTMAHGTPTDQQGRKTHSDVQRWLRSLKFKLVHNETLTRWAEIWYLARVKPGKIADALEELASGQHPELWDIDKGSGINEKYIWDGIRNYDKATGRPRR